MINQNSTKSIAHHIDCCSKSVAIIENRYACDENARLYGEKMNVFSTYRSQSTAMINEMSSDGKPTVSKTITIVTNPADGIPAAPIEAAVAVTLQRIHTKFHYKTNWSIEIPANFHLPNGY